MAKLQFKSQPAKVSDKEQIETLTRQTLALSKYNDRELDEVEIDYERKAEKLDIIKYPRVHPFKATIGFMVRNMQGRNIQAIEYVRASLPFNATNGISNNLVNLITEFDLLDENSKSRVDCLDILCRKNRITIMRFLDALADGIMAFSNKMTMTIVAERKPELAEKIFEQAQLEDKKHTQGKRLAAEVAGLVGKESAIVIDQSTTINKTENNQNNVVLNFSDFVKQNDKEVRGKKLIEEKDYIDAETVE